MSGIFGTQAYIEVLAVIAELCRRQLDPLVLELVNYEQSFDTLPYASSLIGEQNASAYSAEIRDLIKRPWLLNEFSKDLGDILGARRNRGVDSLTTRGRLEHRFDPADQLLV